MKENDGPPPAWTVETLGSVWFVRTEENGIIGPFPREDQARLVAAAPRLAWALRQVRDHLAVVPFGMRTTYEETAYTLAEHALARVEVRT